MQILNHVLRPAVLAAVLTLVTAGCSRNPATAPQLHEDAPQPVRAGLPDPLALVLVPHVGDRPVDEEIRRWQEQVRNGRNRSAALEQLGWAFVAEARGSFDSGFYKLAESCAKALDTESSGSAEARLLRGHVLQNLHRFNEAETIARELVVQRGLSFDYGLLGDTLMEQGRIKEAVVAYQSMVDLRPDLQSYSRIAHVRWLTGDLEGAIEMMQAAASASSPSDAPTAAWVNSRLAGLEWQAGDVNAAKQNCAAALALQPDYPPALLLRGKMLLARNDAEAAIADLQSAAQQNPLPEYQWALAEALRADGREEEADQLDLRFRRHGAAGDPRTFSLYLATRGEDADLAVRLAEEELQQREDVFTHDALAWALAAAGRIDEARSHMATALAEGTEDARLFFHATVIASRAGQNAEAKRWFVRAAELMNLLLPSEKTRLMNITEELTAAEISPSAMVAEGK